MEFKPTEKDDFHKHLDECEQCRNRPFNLCPRGEILLRTVAAAAAAAATARVQVKKEDD